MFKFSSGEGGEESLEYSKTGNYFFEHDYLNSKASANQVTGPLDEKTITPGHMHSIGLATLREAVTPPPPPLALVESGFDSKATAHASNSKVDRISLGQVQGCNFGKQVIPIEFLGSQSIVAFKSYLEDAAELQKRMLSGFQLIQEEYSQQKKENAQLMKTQNEVLSRNAMQRNKVIKNLESLRSQIFTRIYELGLLKSSIQKLPDDELDPIQISEPKMVSMTVLSKKASAIDSTVESTSEHFFQPLSLMQCQVRKYMDHLLMLKAELVNFLNQLDCSTNITGQLVSLRVIISTLMSQNSLERQLLFTKLTWMNQRTFALSNDSCMLRAKSHLADLNGLVKSIQRRMSIFYPLIIFNMKSIIQEREGLFQRLSTTKEELELSKSRLLTLDQVLQHHKRENSRLAIENGNLQIKLQECLISGENAISELKAKNFELQARLEEAERQVHLFSCKRPLEVVGYEVGSSGGEPRSKRIPNYLLQPSTIPLTSSCRDQIETNESNEVKVNQPIIVAFSGIRDSTLKSTLEVFGVKVHDGQEFSNNITHVIAPEGAQSMKVLAASITAKWIMRPSWIEASRRAGRLVPEGEYGVRYGDSPFRGSKFFLTVEFIERNIKNQFNPSCCLILIEKLGKGRIVKSIMEADFIIAADNEPVDIKDVGQKVLYLEHFLRMIPAYIPADRHGNPR